MTINEKKGIIIIFSPQNIWFDGYCTSRVRELGYEKKLKTSSEMRDSIFKAFSLNTRYLSPVEESRIRTGII